MSVLVTQMIIAERYGVRLDTRQLAEVLGLKEGTIRNRISARSFPIPTYQDGGRRWADCRDVAEYLEQKRQDALAEFEKADRSSARR